MFVERGDVVGCNIPGGAGKHALSTLSPSLCTSKACCIKIHIGAEISSQSAYLGVERRVAESLLEPQYIY